MKFTFPPNPPQAPWSDVPPATWSDWRWQMRKSLRTESDYAAAFELNAEERAGFQHGGRFQIRTTPYYAQLADRGKADDPIRRIFMPLGREVSGGVQSMLDPLAERRNMKTPRLVHRYSDRVLFLVTDVCSVYCRYCTRKHFTGQDGALPARDDYEQSLAYIRAHTGLREVILSGGDPLTLSTEQLDRILFDLRAIGHVEVIRIGSRMPVVNPFRVDLELAQMLRRHAPVFLMSHFNHPRELTREASDALALVVDSGIPVFNQMVLLNGVNNHAAIVQALSRRLLYLRVKPYYMFQCDPSEGTDHLRNSVEESLAIQRELWGHLSGLAMPNLALDIPDGGGKAGLVPQFEVAHVNRTRTFVGWDGVSAEYVSPTSDVLTVPSDASSFEAEWTELRNAKRVPGADLT